MQHGRTSKGWKQWIVLEFVVLYGLYHSDFGAYWPRDSKAPGLKHCIDDQWAISAVSRY